MSTCRFCKHFIYEHGSTRVPLKYGPRHYAHYDCFLDSGHTLDELPAYQISKFPYKLIKERGLLNDAERLTRNKVLGGPYA